MQRHDGRNLSGQASGVGMILVFCAFLLLPARFYTSMSLAQGGSSTLVVNYLNGVDLAAAAACFIFSVLGRAAVPDKKSLIVLGVYCFFGVVNSAALIITDQILFVAEPCSKMLMLLTAVTQLLKIQQSIQKEVFMLKLQKVVQKSAIQILQLQTKAQQATLKKSAYTAKKA